MSDAFQSLLRLSGFFGTGSSIFFENGLQRIILQTASAVPMTIPHSLTASMAYCEQVGVNLHVLLPLNGERYFW